MLPILAASIIGSIAVLAIVLLPTPVAATVTATAAALVYLLHRAGRTAGEN